MKKRDRTLLILLLLLILAWRFISRKSKSANGGGATGDKFNTSTIGVEPPHTHTTGNGIRHTIGGGTTPHVTGNERMKWMCGSASNNWECTAIDIRNTIQDPAYAGYYYDTKTECQNACGVGSGTTAGMGVAPGCTLFGCTDPVALNYYPGACADSPATPCCYSYNDCCNKGVYSASVCAE